MTLISKIPDSGRIFIRVTTYNHHVCGRYISLAKDHHCGKRIHGMMWSCFQLYHFHCLIGLARDNLRSASKLPLDSVNNWRVTSASQVATSSMVLLTAGQSWIIEFDGLPDLCLFYWRIIAKLRHICSYDNHYSGTNTNFEQNLSSQWNRIDTSCSHNKLDDWEILMLKAMLLNNFLKRLAISCWLYGNPLRSQV